MSSRRSQDLFRDLSARHRGRGEGRHWSTVRRSLHLFPDCLLHSARRPGLCAAELLRDSSGLGAADHLGHSLYRRTAVEPDRHGPDNVCRQCRGREHHQPRGHAQRIPPRRASRRAGTARRSRPSRKSRGRTFASPTGIGTAPKPSKSAQSALRIARTDVLFIVGGNGSGNRLS